MAFLWRDWRQQQRTTIVHWTLFTMLLTNDGTCRANGTITPAADQAHT